MVVEVLVVVKVLVGYKVFFLMVGIFYCLLSLDVKVFIEVG